MNRRDFIKASTSGLAAATIPAADSGGAADNVAGEGQLGSLRSASSSDLQGLVGDGRQRRILLRGGVVLSLDPRVGDSADVLIDGKRIAEVAPAVSAGDAEIVDCTGTIVMPGFIHTHHHQYETLQRSMIPDGLLQGAWPQESYFSVVQNIWTAGRIPDPANPNNIIWDLGRVPYDPEDCYISELVACLSEISEGITTGTDTSQSSHTPEHTDAMIKGLMDSGRRMVYAYSPGIDRSSGGIRISRSDERHH
jgi:5-methylthioadenosine/S-adenosylhomocysteine deaminase